VPSVPDFISMEITFSRWLNSISSSEEDGFHRIKNFRKLWGKEIEYTNDKNQIKRKLTSKSKSGLISYRFNP